MKTLLAIMLILTNCQTNVEKIYEFDYHWDNNKLELTNIYQELIWQDINSPDIVIKQIILETENCKCNNCCLDNNNLIGFTHNGKYYLYFNNWKSCIKYLKEYQLKYLHKDENYYLFLKRIRWARDEQY